MQTKRRGFCVFANLLACRTWNGRFVWTVAETETKLEIITRNTNMLMFRQQQLWYQNFTLLRFSGHMSRTEAASCLINLTTDKDKTRPRLYVPQHTETLLLQIKTDSFNKATVWMFCWTIILMHMKQQCYVAVDNSLNNVSNWRPTSQIWPLFASYLASKTVL